MRRIPMLLILAACGPTGPSGVGVVVQSCETGSVPALAGPEVASIGWDCEPGGACLPAPVRYDAAVGDAVYACTVGHIVRVLIVDGG